MIRYGKEIPVYLEWDFLYPKDNMSILSKQDKKYFLIVILFSLIHNLIVFPAQAAEEYDDISVLETKLQTEFIKMPETNIAHFEEIKSNEQKIKPEVVKNFKIIAEQKKPEQNNNFKITSLSKDQALPINKGLRTVSLTAYNSEAAQTDGDPCTTANGFNLCKHGAEDSVAANFLPFGTKIMIPDLFGDKVFVVRDRMNKRFSNRVDVWMLSKERALKFGVRQAQIIIIES